MAADWESERESYPDDDYSDGGYLDDDYLDDELWASDDDPDDGYFEDEPAPRRRAGEAGPSRRGNRESRRNASAGRHQAPGRREAAGRRASSGRSAGETAGRKASRSRPAGDIIPDPVPPDQRGKRHHPISRKRRQRRIVALAAVVLLACAAYAAANIIVFRVKEFQVSSATADQQVLSWKDAGGVDSYDIYDSSGTLLAEVDPDEDTQYVADGLEGGTQYTYTIVAVKNFLGRHASKAVECTGYTMPDAVSTVSAINSGTGALLRWEDNGASGYEVQYFDAAGMPQTLQASSSDGSKGLSIPDLQEGSQYTFQIRGYVKDGDSRIYSDWYAAEPITAVHTADMTGIDIDKPMVALTFDDGPDYLDITERILTTLEKYNAHATFFQIGVTVSELPDLTAHIAEMGHEIACHTLDHSHYGSDVTTDDIVVADDLIEQAVGRPPSAFRSPGGMTTDLIRQVCVNENMPIFYWSIDTEDWKSRDADAVCDTVIGHVSDGDIILMHNVYTSTADAVDRIVPYLAEEGYQMVTVSQLVQAKTGAPPVPGTQYVTATITN